MAYSVSNNFKASIKDAKKPKSCIILFDDTFFASEDFTGDVTVQQYFNTSEDLTFGDCPSDSLSFSIISNGKLVGYSFGRAKVYFGTMTASADYSMGSNLAHIEIGNVSYNATENGLYRGSTKIDDGRYVSLVSDGTTVYAVGPDGAVKVVNSTSAVSKYVPTAFMADKLLTPTSAVFNGSTATVWTDGTKYMYEYVPMGEYNVEKPRSTVGAVVQISDAYDDMTKFDRDASDFVSAITYPITLGELFEDLCEYCGVSYVTSTFPNSNLSMSSSLFSNSSFNCRQILSWIAGKAYRVAHMNRTGQLELVWLSNDVESLTASDVMTDGYSVSEYVTQAVDSVLLKAQNGSSVTYGDSSNNPYPITGNPFINTITAEDLAQYKAIPTYVPIAMSVFEADPSVDIGDRIDFEKIALDYVALSDIFANVYADVDRTLLLQQYGEAYQYPLMNRTIVFNGGLKATYEATGNQKREYDASYTEYNALISVNESQLNGAVNEAKLYSDEELNAFKNGTYATFVTSTNNGISSARTAAENAATAASNAQSTANGAVTAAGNAQTAAGNAQTTANNAASAAATAQQTANSKITTYYQTTAPATHNTGDLWIDTDDGNKLYRYNGSTWVNVQDANIQIAIANAATAQATADGKIMTYAQNDAPTDDPEGTLDEGDLWIDTNDNNKLYRWSGSSWLQYTDNSAVVAYDQQLDQMAVFNKLTNNQANQGVYIQNGQVYVNASMIMAGILSGIEINNGNGTFRVDENGNVTANSLSSSNAAITGGSIDVSRNETRGSTAFNILSRFLRIINTYDNGETDINAGSARFYTPNNNNNELIILANSISASTGVGLLSWMINSGGISFMSGNTLVSYPASGISSISGNATKGSIRFKQGKVQIAWNTVTWTGKLNHAWGSGIYESASVISLGNWQQSFNAAPSVAYSANSNGNLTAWVAAGTSSPSASSAGSIVLERVNSSDAQQTWTVRAIAVGTYT